jgi:hypothetical protein
VTKVETQRDLRVAVDRLDLWLSTGREIDGLWVGTIEGKPHPGLHRVEDALRLIKHHSSLHYSRVTRNLERLWVHLLPDASACYYEALGACMLDERFVLQETMTLEELASTIVHEATHARLEQWGIRYDEQVRARIEAVCIRRELNFIAKLPHSEPLREQKARALEWCVSDHEYFSNVSFQQRDHQGNVETLRYLGTPEWVIRFIFRTLPVVFAVRRLIRRLAGPRQQT